MSKLRRTDCEKEKKKIGRNYVSRPRGSLSITQLPLTIGSNMKDDTSPPATMVPSFGKISTSFWHRPYIPRSRFPLVNEVMTPACLHTKLAFHASVIGIFFQTASVDICRLLRFNFTTQATDSGHNFKWKISVIKYTMNVIIEFDVIINHRNHSVMNSHE